MGMQRPEAAAEILVLVDRHLLVAEEDHQVVHQRIVHFLELLVAERLGEIDAEDLGTDGGRKLAHLDRLIGHGFLRWLQARWQRSMPARLQPHGQSGQSPYYGVTAGGLAPETPHFFLAFGAFFFALL